MSGDYKTYCPEYNSLTQVEITAKLDKAKGVDAKSAEKEKKAAEVAKKIADKKAKDKMDECLKTSTKE